MGYYAYINDDGLVTNVIIADHDFIAALADAERYIETDPNTRGGKHYALSGEMDSGVPLRKNAASLGCTYDAARDAFIPPRNFPSWTLDEESCLWVAPVAYPTDGKVYMWDEENAAWVAAGGAGSVNILTV